MTKVAELRVLPLPPAQITLTPLYNYESLEAEEAETLGAAQVDHFTLK